MAFSQIYVEKFIIFTQQGCVSTYESFLRFRVLKRVENLYLILMLHWEI